MKYLFLALMCVFAFGCDDEPGNNCQQYLDAFCSHVGNECYYFSGYQYEDHAREAGCDWMANQIHGILDDFEKNGCDADKMWEICK